MALAGVHVVFGFAGSATARETDAALLKPVSSETLPTAATTTISAPAASGAYGAPMASVFAVADSFIAAAATPNATTGTRVFCPAGERIEFYVDPGDKIAWVAA